MTPQTAKTASPADDARAELAAGLTAQHATLHPKFFYDTLGSTLFEAICLLDEYDLTRTEAAIFDRHLPEITRAIGPGSVFIDLGAGNCAKAAKLLPHLRPDLYVAVDISTDFLTQALAKLQDSHPALRMTSLEADFTRHFDLPREIPAENRVFFYPGSSLGNFNPLEARAFLSHLRPKASGLLIGIDLVKSPAELEAAYDDSLGVTAAFNLNILRRVNRELGANFDLRAWRHRALFNPDLSRVEMHLEARTPQTVRWPGAARAFAQGERIHTENSYKYLPGQAEALLAAAGFKPVESWTDEQGWFGVHLGRVI